jgi:hypothetical protein
MRTTVVPAQVTTVEDKVAGNISISQLMLFVTPVFIGSLLFVILPSFFSYATYKLVLILFIVTLCATLAIRIKGKILLFWIGVMIKYNSRPQYYVCCKNSDYLRYEAIEKNLDDLENVKTESKENWSRRAKVTTADMVYTEDIIAQPNANFHLRVDKKGRLSVHFTEVQ